MRTCCITSSCNIIFFGRVTVSVLTMYVDAEQIILEVQKRPPLFEPTDPEYIDKVKRRQDWDGVCQALFYGWDELSSSDTKDKCKYVYIS
ncbi:hypothetical protein XELAEV_18003766mg [Xenopus laevis]|nr:hypothetical protein XELAEV_18003766mg [Xenopus laevis]